MYQLRPEPQTKGANTMSEIQIKAGKWRQRNGRIVNVKSLVPSVTMPKFYWSDENCMTYRENGRIMSNDEHPFDLFEHIPDEPTQPEPAKAELVPGWYVTLHDLKKYRLLAKTTKGSWVYEDELGNVGKVTNPVFIDELTPYTPPPEPRTWTKEVVAYLYLCENEPTFAVADVGIEIPNGAKELGRTTVTIKENVTQCPTP